MFCHPKTGSRWRDGNCGAYAYAITLVIAMTLALAASPSARATVVDSSHDQPVSLNAPPPEPSALLQRLLLSPHPLGWREDPEGVIASDREQIIWPPIDQPLDLRGGYKQLPEPVAERQPEVSPENPTSTPRLSKADCEAAGAFILAGARARDQGVSAERFLGQLRSDLLKLGAEPPATRWFLHTKLEAQLLLSAATRIYQEPQAAASHFTGFIKTCDAHRASR